MTLVDHGNYGTFLDMGTAGFVSSTVVFMNRYLYRNHKGNSLYE